MADAGVQALDDGLAEVAVAFSSNPQLSRPDILTLRDDERWSPVATRPHGPRKLLRRYGAPLRRRLDTASRLCPRSSCAGSTSRSSTAGSPRPSAASSPTPTGSAGAALAAGRVRGSESRFSPFDENETLAHFYAAVLRGDGYRVTVRSTGLRLVTVRAMRRGRDRHVGGLQRGRCAATFPGKSTLEAGLPARSGRSR